MSKKIEFECVFNTGDDKLVVSDEGNFSFLVVDGKSESIAFLRRDQALELANFIIEKIAYRANSGGQKDEN